VKKSTQIINILGGLKIWWLNIDTKPAGCGTVNISIYIWCLLHLHKNAICDWIEIKHNRLFFKSETLMSLTNDRIYVFIDRLF